MLRLGCWPHGMLALTFLLTGCATNPPRISLAGSETSIRAYSESINIAGRFSAQFQHDDKPESWTGSFTWTQSPQNTVVTLQSPLGQTLATITVNQTGATLTQSGQAPRRAANVDALVADALGWPLPISNLRDWLQAYVVTADGKKIVTPPQSTDAISTRDGWSLHFVSWQGSSETGVQNIPRRIDMERATTEAGTVTMRLIINDWQAH